MSYKDSIRYKVKNLLKSNKSREGEKYIDECLHQYLLWDFFQEIINEINPCTIPNIRKVFGPEYSLRILGDLGYSQTWDCYGQLKEDATDIEKRMQVILAEVLAWNTNAIYADIVLVVDETDNPQKGIEFCFALKDGNTVDKRILTESLKKQTEQESFHVFADSHLIRETRLNGFEGDAPSLDKISTIENLMIGDHTKLELDAREKYEVLNDKKSTVNANTENQDSDDISSFLKETLKREDEEGYTYIQFVHGNDTNYTKRNENIRFAVHLFLILKKTAKPDESVISGIEKLVQSFAITATLEKQKEQQRQLEREAQMLRLLEEPLNQITAGLERTAESAQRLRAVLYDPQQSIFSAASQIWPYFEEGRKINIAGEQQVEVAHKLEDYKNKEDGLKRLSLILLAILSEIFGKDPQKATSKKELLDIYDNYIEHQDISFVGLQKICRDIIETPKSNGKNYTSYQVFQHLQNQVYDSDCQNQKEIVEHLVAVLGRFKRLLHEPYKFHPNSFSIMPLAFIVLVQSGQGRENPPKLKVKGHRTIEKTYSDLSDFLKSDDSEEYSVFCKSYLPFPRAATLWTLVQHLVSQKTPALKCATVEGQKIELVFNSNLLELEQDALAATLKGLIEVKSSTGFLGGDSTSHWFEFALACEGKVVDSKGVNYGFLISIEKRSTKFIFEVEKNTVRFSIDTVTTSKTTSENDKSDQNRDPQSIIVPSSNEALDEDRAFLSGDPSSSSESQS